MEPFSPFFPLSFSLYQDAHRDQKGRRIRNCPAQLGRSIICPIEETASCAVLPVPIPSQYRNGCAHVLLLLPRNDITKVDPERCAWILSISVVRDVSDSLARRCET